MSEVVNKKKRAFWHNDNEGKSSLDLLLDWMTTEGNYSKWKGGYVKKDAIAKEILFFLKEKGMKTNRSPRDVSMKVYEIETKYKKAKDFLSGTGAGILTEVSLKKEVEKICPYYYMLESVFGDRASFVPLADETDLTYEKVDEESAITDDLGELRVFFFHFLSLRLF